MYPSAPLSGRSGEGDPKVAASGVTQCRVLLRGTYDATRPLSSSGPIAALPSRKEVLTRARGRAGRSCQLVNDTSLGGRSTFAFSSASRNSDASL